MKVAKNTVVSLSYRLYVDDGESGKEFREETTDKAPMVFLFGHQGMLPRFEESIADLQEGDSFGFSIGWEDAYGDYDEERITYLPKSSFKDDRGKIMKDQLRTGRVIPMTDGKGNHLHATILKVEMGRVKVDLNHPLAGYDLHFEGRILHVREADEVEIAHGHVHGPGGHHH